MVDWPLEDGTVIRTQVQPVFCANCGVPYGYVPTENTSFAFWLCQLCFETHGTPPGTYVSSDDDFREKLKNEMQDRFGRPLTARELLAKSERGELGTAIEKLIRESPHKEFNR